MRAGSSRWSGCSGRGGFGTGSAAQPPCSAGHRHFRGDPVPAHTPDLSGPARYPKNCLREPCGHHMHTQGKRPRGLSVRRPSPGPSPHRRAEAKAVKPKKLLRRQPGLHPFVQAAQWKPAPEVLGLAPQAKWVFHVVFQGEGRCCHQDGPASPSSGVYSHKCTCTPCTWLLPKLGATQLSPGQWLPAL